VRLARWILALVAGCELGCDRQILVGSEGTMDASSSPDDAFGAAAAGDALVLDGTDRDGGSTTAGDSGLVPLAVPWSTGFENAPGDSWLPGDPSTCYASAGARFQIVTTPVHSGQHAAAFTIDTAVASPSQTRCIKQGVLPAAAYYGAFYYVPTTATNLVNWNLLHFQGANAADAAAAHGLWDVSLTNASDGTLHAVVYDFLRTRTLQTAGAVPVGVWVHLEVFLRRAADGTGQFTLRRDGQVILDLTGLSTDDSRWGQWFVGNYALAISPPSSTVYVDDVMIGLVSSGP
jgi:hypothetical protein